MENFTFCSPTNFVFGKGTEEKVGELCSKYGAKKILIVYGGGSVVRSGLLDRVKDSLTKAGLVYTELGGVKPNPEDDKVREGIKMVREEGIDFLLPVGGGSTIDTAKGIACGALYDGDFWDFYVGKSVIQKAMPVGVVLTIPAAGSEGSGNSVITNTSTMQKLSLRCPDYLRPVFSIMNPELTFTLSPYQTACGICDMMVHIFERYFTNSDAVGISDRLCEGILESIMEEAPKVMADPENYDARANLMWAGNIAHNGTCGIGRIEDWSSHFIEHEISSMYGVTHGAGLSVIFPAWMEFTSKINPSKAKQLSIRVLGVSPNYLNDDVIALGINKLREFWKSLGLPVTMHELGVDNPDIDALVRNLHANKGEIIGNYVPLTKDMTRQILELANR